MDADSGTDEQPTTRTKHTIPKAIRIIRTLLLCDPFRNRKATSRGMKIPRSTAAASKSPVASNSTDTQAPSLQSMVGIDVRRFISLNRRPLVTDRSKFHDFTRAINQHKSRSFSPGRLFHKNPPTILRSLRSRKHFLRPTPLHRRLNRDLHRPHIRYRFPRYDAGLFHRVRTPRQRHNQQQCRNQSHPP
jgi:hypothetical protein